MRKLLAIILVMTICLSVYAETNYVDKGTLMQKFEEEDAEEQAEFTDERILYVQQKLVDFPFSNRPPNAANIYISNSEGNDSNDGLSEFTPWKTLDKLNNVEIYPGDRFFFMRGDEWRGEIIRENLDNVSFSDYGEEYDDKPVINGAVVISDWEDANLTDQFGTPIPNVYVADLPVEYTNLVVKQLFVDGERQTLARFPNESYWDIDDIETHIYDEVTTNIVVEQGETNIVIDIEVITNVTTLIDHDLFASPYYFPPNYWSDSTVFVRYHAFKIFSFDIGYSNGINGSVLPLKNYLDKSFMDLSSPNRGGYFIANSIHAIDVHGEWYYDEPSKKIYLCRDSGDPDYCTIEASVYPYGFGFKDSQHISIDNFKIKYSANNGINFIKESIGNDFNIVSNEIEKACEYGVYIGRVGLVYSPGVNIKNCNIIDSGLFGIKCHYTTYTEIFDNYINSSGLDGEKSGSGIKLFFCNWSAVPRTYNIIKRNRVFNSGYDGISFCGYGSLVTENFVSNCCTVLNDGGAIYGMQKYVSWSEVSRNILMDGVGNIDHSRWGKAMALGIYIDTDELGKYVNVASNTVINTTAGFAVKNITSIWVNANTFYHNTNMEMGFSRSNTVNSTSLFNIIVTESENAVNMGDFFNNEQLFFDSNYYCNVYEDTPEYFVVTTNYISYRFNSTEWKDNFSQDVHSVDAGAMLRDACDNLCESRILYNPTLENKTFDLEGMEYFDIETNKVTGSVILAPFASKVLFFKADKHFVSHDGEHVSPFYYPEVAATNFQSAINVAGTDHTVLVAEGTYLPNQELSITTDIKVKSIAGAATTIIDGDDSHRCVRLNNSGAVLDGFTLTRGYTYYGHPGGGVYCTAGTVQNCIIKDNGAYYQGGGAYCDGQGTLLNCLIKENDSFYGGGVYEAGGHIINSTIIDNYAYSCAGGVYRGGFWPNVGNIYNSIIYNNYAYCGPNHYPLYPTAHTMLYYCYTDNPQFADSDGRLSSDSPCADAGGRMILGNFDLDGFAKVRGTRIDIGAYESAQTISDSTNVTGYMTAYISWTGPEYVDVWRNTSGTYTDYSPTNSDWVVEAANVTSPYAFPVYQYIYTHYNTPIYIHLTHTDIAHPMYEDDSVITIEPWDPAYFYYW
ncbi:hypothetical protein KAH27_02105 [bacterium]|nr:hypothetical protein [bacterium]